MRYSQALAASSVSPEEELAQVIGETIHALQGCGAALTLHPKDGRGRLVFADGSAVLANVDYLLTEGVLDPRPDGVDEHAWLEAPFEGCSPHALVLPIGRVPGHSPLVITIFFEDLDDQRRGAAEAAYLRRRPFAVGYFRLWQLERLHRHQVNALQAALDLVDIGIALITKSGTLGFVNKAARNLLDEGNGLYEQRGRLRARSRADSIVLDVSITEVLDASGDPGLQRRVPLFTVDRSNKSPLIVSVLPAPGSVTEDGEIAALFFAVNPDQDIGKLSAAVCQVFHLTPLETKLACELASGSSLAEAAKKLGVKEATARSYLKAIFMKTGTNRQAALVRLILMSLVRASDGRTFDTVPRFGPRSLSAANSGKPKPKT